jgi:solute carrier family 35 protein E1
MAMSNSSGTDGENSLGANLTAPNMFGLVTCAAFWISIPLAFATEGNAFFEAAGTIVDPESLAPVPLPSLWQTAVDSTDKGAAGLIQSIVISGLFHYLNNEVMYLALSNVHPVTLAVGNTMKRVFIMVASVMVFRNQISLQAAIGSAVGISGVLLYSLTKQYYEKLEKEQNNKENKPLVGKATNRKEPSGRKIAARQ